ncbi:MAG: GTP-dependent dephospho-CoA kinase family protein [Thermoproteota archaeon]
MSLRASDETRRVAKKPLGLLVREEVCLTDLLKGFEGMLISVGDVVSRRLIEKGFDPSVCIVDGKTMREIITGFESFLQGRNILRLVNPPGTISGDSWHIVKEALASNPSTIIVDGEEDLLTLVAIEVAPEGSMVLYGQPREGIVIVRVDETSKRLVSEILKTMEPQ